MGDDNERDPILDVFIFEANQLIEKLEEIMLDTEKNGELPQDNINEIFRIMHTIKGSSAMMMFEGISKLAHCVEDLFYFIRENKPENLDITTLCDLVLSASDFIKREVSKINDGLPADGVDDGIEAKLRAHLELISQAGAPQPQAVEEAEAQPAAGPAAGACGDRFIVEARFEEGGQMENLRAYTIVRNLLEFTGELYTSPGDIINAQAEQILENGFKLFFTSEKAQMELQSVFDEALFLKSYEITRVDSYEAELRELGLRPVPRAAAEQPRAMQAAAAALPAAEPAAEPGKAAEPIPRGSKLSLISVNINKLDTLMNLVGEIVISESMVTKNPDLDGLKLESFNKASRQLRKLTDELQDIVMSIRMVQISGTFQKMQRLVRDMSHKLGKNVEFVTEGETTEVDKNIIDHLSDPLMHLIRNAVDHGVETQEERVKAGKGPTGRITLSARNTGGDVHISVADDGRGLDRGKILKKAQEQGLLKKAPADMTDREVYALTLLPGFSTKESVTEFSGRGVGMDVVKQNIEEVGGSVSIRSAAGQGTTVTIIIPLTLAIADAMELSVGDCIFTLPTTTIRESFRPKENEIICDNMGNEMIMIRGSVYPIIRLHKLYKLETEVLKLSEGILILADGENKSACIFADSLLGEQQIVVKPLPPYLVRYNVKEMGVEGCTILGNGGISLILNAKGLINRVI